jgi:hypothetical protein
MKQFIVMLVEEDITGYKKTTPICICGSMPYARKALKRIKEEPAYKNETLQIYMRDSDDENS